jgi:hypothetical protein
VIEIKVVVEVGIIIEGCAALRCVAVVSGGRSWCTVTTVRVTGSQAAFWVGRLRSGCLFRFP